MKNTTFFSPITHFCEDSELPYYISVELFIAILTGIGNGLQIQVIRNTDALQTFNNYLLGWKALLDILQAVSLPFVSLFFFEYFLMRFTYVLLAIIFSVVYSVSIFVSSFVTLFIAIDRFQAIIYPLSITRRCRNLKVILSTTSTISLVLSGLFVFKRYNEDPSSEKILIPMTTIFVFLPMVISGVLYVCICVKIFRRKIPGNSNQQNEERNRMTRRVVLSLMIMTASLYATLTLFILIVMNKMSCFKLQMNFITRVDGVIMPWIYFLLIKQYRNGLRKMLRGSRSVAPVVAGNCDGQRDLHEETKC